MQVLKKIADFINYDLLKQGNDATYTEFLHKYHNSIIRVNGKLGEVTNIDKKNHILYFFFIDTKDTTPVTKMDSIENYMPKTGLYKLDEETIYLYRLPNRQWIKSFCLGANYDALSLTTAKDKGTEVIKILTNPKTEYAEESIISNSGKVFLHWKEVGHNKQGSNKIVLKDTTFEKEIKELWKQYRVTLDVPHQQELTEEKLILDF